MKTISNSALIGQILIILLASSGVYFNTLFNGFVYDDIYQVVNNPWIRDPHTIIKIFSTGAWGFNATETNYYRPFMHLIYMFTYALFKLEPWGYHLVNIVFHAANSILAFFVTSEVMKMTRQDPRGLWTFMPLIAAIIFSVHPIHTEAVAWIGGIPDLSFTLFFLLSLYLYIIAEKKEPKMEAFFLGVSIVSFFIAMLCKEPAATLPLVILLYDLSFNRSRMSVSFCTKRYSFYFVVLGSYFIIRLAALGGFSPVNKHSEFTLFQSFLNIFPLFTKYVYFLFIPVNLKAWHSFQPVLNTYDLKFLSALGLTLSFFLFSLYTFRANKIIFFGICLFIVPLLPALYIPGMGENPFAERYLYLPSLGFALLASMLIVKLSAVTSYGKIVVSALFLILFAFYSTETFSRNYAWKDELTFWTATVRESPDEPLPHYNLGAALERHGRLDEAIEEYQKAISLKPASVAYKALGEVYYRKGYKNKAVLEYYKALELEPQSSEMHNEAGIILMETGNFDKAQEHFRKAVDLVPDNPKLRYNLAMALSKNEKIPEAIEQLKIAVKLDPSQAAFSSALQKLSAEKN